MEPELIRQGLLITSGLQLSAGGLMGHWWQGALVLFLQEGSAAQVTSATMRMLEKQHRCGSQLKGWERDGPEMLADILGSVGLTFELF